MRRLVISAPTVLALGMALAAHEVRAQDACAIEGFTSPPRSDAQALLAQWTDEAVALSPLGADASFDLDALEVHATFDETDGTTASLDASAEPAGLLGLLSGAGAEWSVADVVIDGLTGTLEVSGSSVTVAGGTLSSATVTQASTSPERTGVALALLADDALALSLAGAVLSGYDSAQLVDAEGVSTILGASVVLTSAGALTSSTNAFVALVDTASLEHGAFALAGDFTAGTTTVDGAPIESARTIVGRSGLMVIDGLGASGSARVTQVFDDEAPRMQADVEIVVASPLAVVAPGTSVNVPALVRNKSGTAIAILEAIEVDGCAAAAVTPVVDDTLPGFVTVLVGVIEQSGWAAPFVALALAPVLGVAIVVDAFVAIADAFTDVVGDIFCGIFGCDDEEQPPTPVPPIPYPRWLEPGAVAAFEIALLPNLAEDDYPVRVRFLGKNHAETHVDFTIRVGRGDVPSSWGCEVERYGADDGCDCGCNALDSDCPGGATIEDCDVDACFPGFNHLEEDLAVCVRDPQPPPPEGIDGDDDDDDDDRWDCSATPMTSWAMLAGLLLLLRRRRFA